MEGTVTTLIILILGAALAVTLFMLFKGKPATVKKNTNDPDKSEHREASEQYRLIYMQDDSFETKGVEELIAIISDAHDPKIYAKSYIYYDEELCSRYVSIGRDKSNTYQLGAPSVDRFAAICVAKVGNEYRIKANTDSRNGLSYEFKGKRITDTISFYDNITLYMGSVRIDLALPGHETVPRSRSINEVFSDLRNAAGVTDTAKTRVWNRRNENCMR